MHRRYKETKKRKKRKKPRNVLNGSHTDVLSPTTISSHHFLLTRKLNSVSSFTLPFTFHLQPQTRSGMKRNKSTKKRGTKTWVWRVLRGKVQVCRSSCASQYKKMLQVLQVVQLSCQQDRLRADQAPPPR